MPTRATYAVHVHEIEQRTPHQRRVVLTGADLAGFPADFEGGYVKLLLPGPGADPLEAPPARCKRRSYTVRAFDRAARTLTLDFALHDATGPAMRWVDGASVGDAIRITGPGPVKRLDPAADWVLLAGDLAALPAIAVNLERLPPTAKGYALVEIPSPEDRQPLERPEGVEVRWLVNESGHPDASPLAEGVRALTWAPGRVSAWIACEFSVMRTLRAYLRNEHPIDPDALYLSSYWKWRATDEQHKAAKAADRGSSFLARLARRLGSLRG
ncbi:MAG: siderophore-interacting protein [Planctomycetota bacterium]